MSERKAVEMDDAETAQFLDESRTAVLATSSPSGFPHLVAMWFVPLGADIAIWAYASSQKVANIRRDPRVALLVESGDTYETLRGVSMDARVEFIEDADAVAVLGERLTRRYTGGPPYRIGDEISPAAQKQARKRVGLILHPERYRTWDHAKLRRE